MERLTRTLRIACELGRTLRWVVVVFGLSGPASAQEFLPLDQSTAVALQPYSEMACSAYGGCGAGTLTGTGYKFDLDWTQAMDRSGVGKNVRSLYEQSGFSATIYRNDQNKEIVVAYRGTDDGTLPAAEMAKLQGRLRDMKGDGATDLQALRWRSPNDGLITQYVAARSLAARIKDTYANTPYQNYSVTLTGHSLGGALASYAGQHVNAQVYTFEPARNQLAGTSANAKQTNVIVSGDPISDPRAPAAKQMGSVNYLPGRTYRMDLPAVSTVQVQSAPDLRPRHDAALVVSLIGKIAEPNRAQPSSLSSGPPPWTPDVLKFKDISSLQSPQTSRPVVSTKGALTLAVAPSGSTFAQPAPVPRPGGISLSRAAADRMPLDIALDASALSDGKIVLSGRASKTRMDAALFLTALRAACDDHDPYFSLDPDNGALWSQQGEQASNEFWEKIKKDFPSDAPARAKNAQPGVNARTISATQDYSGIWQNLSPRYPNFRAKLVFYPEWLRQTRLGEVLYKADVLLKELSSGVSILVPGKLRASAIPGYLAADVEYAAKSLLASTRDQLAVRPQWRGSRLWFEITPSELPTNIMIETTAPSSSGDPALRLLLQSKGLIRSADQSVQNASFFMRHGNVFDLSQVNPIMFVRVHDHTTNKDLSDHDPRLDGLATDVSTRFDQYAQYYDELRLLREVFRAYIAARKITEANDRLCGTLDAMPLLDSEKLAARLPDYHPSELFVTIASYSTVSRKGSQTQFVKASSMSGGVSIAGQKFTETAMRDGETTLTRAVVAALAGVNLGQADAIDSDRKFISFIVDDRSGAPVRLVSSARDLLGPRSLSDYPIENEPAARANPFARTSNQRNDTLIETLAAILIIGLVFSYLVRKRRGARG